jgi:hypothetical protein
MTIPIDFLSGLITATFLACSGFFLRYWARSKDILFAGFALTFLLLATGQALATMLSLAAEERTWAYLIRLAAFVVLIITIIRKNLAK